MSRYLDLIKERPLVLDGAMGTMLYQQGVFVNACYEELSITRPALVSAIHAEYADAGADVLLTNTFGANRIKLGEFGLAGDAVRINSAAVEIARKAAGESVLVAGDVGPCEARGNAMSDPHAVEAAFAEQMSALASAGADLIFLETFSNPEELKIAARCAASTGIPVHASVAVDEDGVSAFGVPLADLLEALDADENIDTAGINCGVGPAELFALFGKSGIKTVKPLLVKPNAGHPREVGGRMLYMTSPEYFTEYAKRFIQLGVRGIGGCCGTTPEHIRCAAKAVKSLREVRKHSDIHIVTAEERAASAVPPMEERSSEFAAKLVRGEKITSVEILPPKSPDMTQFIEKARQCMEAGVDAINIPDGPRASPRVSPLVTSILLKNAVRGIEPIPHFCCRDRNLLGLQADLLAAAAAGIHNILDITGDPPKDGGGPAITGVFDVESVGLAAMMDGLNRGFDFTGAPVKPASSFVIGVGLNPCAVNIDKEIGQFIDKINIGADYAITQPVFDADVFLRFMEKVAARPGYRSIPVIAGVYPLASYRNADFMRTEVEGVVIPDAVLEKLSKCTSKEDGLAAGIEICHGIMEKIAGTVSGFEVSATFGNVRAALEVLSL